VSKLRRLSTTGFAPVEYHNTFARQHLRWFRWRLIVCPAADPVGVLRDLLLALWPPPYRVRYVLVVSRTGREPGRYDLPTPLDVASLTAFLEQHGSFLAGDPRHDLWLAGPDRTTRIVYDRHDVLYVYGRLRAAERLLQARGFQRGSVSYPEVHVHEYLEAFDDAEQRLLTGHFWQGGPLEDGDQT
jgi:hypothetical protein